MRLKIILLATFAIGLLIIAGYTQIYSGEGYIPYECQVNWTHAGLLPESRGGLLPRLL